MGEVAPLTPDQRKAVEIKKILNSRAEELAKALPAHITPERMIRLALTSIAKNPKLMDCTPTSIYGSVLEASQLGVEIDVDGQAYLVPYKGKAQLIIGYRGMLLRAWRSTYVTKIVARNVWSDDYFAFHYGIEEKLEHQPKMPRGEEARLDYSYAIAWLKDCPSPLFVVMSRAELDDIRNRSKAKNDGPWMTDPAAMCLKTALRQLFRFLPAEGDDPVRRKLEQEDRIEDDPDAIDAEFTSEPSSGEDHKGDVPPGGVPSPDSGVSEEEGSGDPIPIGPDGEPLDVKIYCPGCERSWALIKMGEGHAPGCTKEGQ